MTSRQTHGDTSPQAGDGKADSATANDRRRGGRRKEDIDASYLARLIDLGIALSAETNHDRLTEKILVEAKEFTKADGGTLYLVGDDGQSLHFKILRNDTLNTVLGGTTGRPVPFPPLRLFNAETGAPNHNNVATHVALTGRSINIEDAYTAEGFDFSGTKRFDEGTGYRSKSFLTLPLKTVTGEVIGVLQLINAQDGHGGVIPFAPNIQPMVEALASQAAVAIDNQRLLQAQRDLLDSFIKVLARAIDAKSPYTGGHCERVPILAKMLAQAACNQTEGPFAAYALDDEEWYELHLAAWLHDCGKVTTPEYVVDKATKLETIYDRIHEVRTRFEVLRRDAEIDMLRRQLAGEDKAATEAAFAARVGELEEQFAFVAETNIGGEFMAPDKIDRLQVIGAQTWTRYFDRSLGLSWEESTRLKTDPPAPAPAVERLLQDRGDHQVGIYNRGEVYNLSVQRGTLTAEERKVINDHIVVTQEMLKQLPFPKSLKKVPQIAGNHHEKIDGTGYPNGLTGDQMGTLEKIMAIADVFEALTAADRPYKTPKTISECVKILSFMRKDKHVDSDLFDLFLSSGVYREYAEQYLRPEQVDEVNIAAYLSRPVSAGVAG
ncbi:HD family phosphohydrolase [Novispirillum itersonii]|uniref:HD-GYP domain-containing protein (C-di-GMP phosphodiesterase class II) n=1 Tax=Novispirillum itersonii TaxID=189 RepID=A0A7W9ZD18_NOVIT|nr:HD family phosphohydrolase [Novispirillum itersonii]MBB6209242.1 HD-GYP domain-containing protein (c-di-GMP phosphodiesterase class II) [Novispirillum itersonii]